MTFKVTLQWEQECLTQKSIGLHPFLMYKLTGSQQALTKQSDLSTKEL